MNILEQNVTAEKTPGEQHFPPFEISADVIALADERISHYPESKLSAVLPLIHIVQHKHGFVRNEAITWHASYPELERLKLL